MSGVQVSHMPRTSPAIADAILAKRLQDSMSLLEASAAAGQRQISLLQVRACDHTLSCKVIRLDNIRCLAHHNCRHTKVTIVIGLPVQRGSHPSQSIMQALFHLFGFFFR